MNPFEFVIALVFLVFVGNAVKAYFESKRDAANKSEERENESAADLDRLADLEERVRTLERIVTDEQFELNRRFKNL